MRSEGRGVESGPEGAAVSACKHQSAWETTVFYVLADDPSYVLKKELLFLPFWGWVARKCKAIGVDRAGGIGALKRLVRDSSAALDANRQVIIFPEGSRMAPGRTRPYYPGIAAIYAATEAPVVPVALNSGVFWGRRRFLKRPGVITLEFLPPVPRGLDRRAFLPELQARIQTASDRPRAEAEAKVGAEPTGPRAPPGRPPDRECAARQPDERGQEGEAGLGPADSGGGDVGEAPGTRPGSQAAVVLSR